MSKKISSASAAKLYASLPPERIAYEDSSKIPLRKKLTPPQPRAMAALELALNIEETGYNIYLSGQVNLGRTYMINDFLEPRAKKSPTPPDLVYVNNFEDPDAPQLLSLPAGQGQKLKSSLNKAINRIRKELPIYMERDSYTKQRSSLMGNFQNQKSRIFQDMDKIAGSHGFKLDMDDSGTMSLYPLVQGKRLSEEEFDELDDSARDTLKRKGDELAGTMHGYLRKLGRMEQDLTDNERSLERDVAGELISSIIDPVAERFKLSCNGSLPMSYFEQLKEDILDSLDFFLPPEHGGQTPPHIPGLPDAPHFEDIAHRYDINIFVDNSKTNGAPVVLEDNPNAANVLGCIERESEMGALITNFTLIKAGALHRANGGFLVLQMDDIIQHPQAWEGLLRALRSGQAKMDDLGDGDGVKTKGILPAPLKLGLKVILIGNDDMYEALLDADPRFSKLFKIKAQMSRHMPRDAKGIKVYLMQIRRIIEEAGLLHFDRASLAGLIDFGSLLLEDQKNLSLEFPLLRELMVESSAHARMEGAATVSLAHLRKAMEARDFRINLIEELFMEEYDRKLIKVRTSGEGIGTVNGLSVTGYGDYEFGLPHQISCTVGVGHGGIVDLEREAQLGGPIHTKAIMILKSYLVSQFARKKPLILTGSICFEQSYVGIEGDSASGAELAGLLSAIARVPLRLDLAFTGALSQSGQIMAVGGVTHKIEGFFEVCRRHGLTGSQGVIMPKDNLEHLMLKKSVLEAVAEGKFHVYPVEHISQAMELLTGMPCGSMRKDGSFTPGSLFSLVDKRLVELAKIARKNGTDKF
ncbi:AAA family ATPase [Desulfovibrio sp. OttesenSCG-928-F07]|nr:AAA family ATPase [Desulfovibrio sp. OttesenSCG-928-F07]